MSSPPMSKENDSTAADESNVANTEHSQCISTNCGSNTQTRCSCTSSTVSNETTMRRPTFWGRLSTSVELWASKGDSLHEYDCEDNSVDRDEKDEPPESKSTHYCKYFSCNVKHKVHSTLRVLKVAMTSPNILLITFIIFAALGATALYAVLSHANEYDSKSRNQLADKAQEVGYWISRELNEALSPLFTLSQFVQYLETFKELPNQIKQRGEPGAAPPFPGKEISHRDVSGICDDPTIIDEFNEIAASMKNQSRMGKSLVNIQLAPMGVVCLAYPLINTEDFDDGKVMNNTAAIGMDQLSDPNRVAMALETISTPGIVIAGPLSLIQDDSEIVNKAFIARLAINMEGYKITVDGIDYPCWGFATILVNWQSFKTGIGLYDVLENNGMEFRLTRTDTLLDTDTNEFYEKVVVIAESQNSEELNDSNSIKVPLNTTNNMWELQVTYEKGFGAPWKLSLSICVVLASFIISITLACVLAAKKEQKMLLYKMMPRKLIRQLQNGETVVEKYDSATIFVSEIVGFTALTGKMKPVKVMELLNQLYTMFDELALKFNVHKVDAVGNQYIVVGGSPGKIKDGEGAERVALFALEAVDFVKNFKMEDGINVFIRTGIATGPVVAGVVGKTVPKYTLFGDTVNLAFDMESTSKKMKIQCDDNTFSLLKDSKNHLFQCNERFEGGRSGVHVNERGWQHTWWIKGIR